MKSTAVALEGRGGGFDARLANGELLRPEAVVLASPGPVTAGLLDEIAPAAAAHVRVDHPRLDGRRLARLPARPVRRSRRLATGSSSPKGSRSRSMPAR